MLISGIISEFGEIPSRTKILRSTDYPIISTTPSPSKHSSQIRPPTNYPYRRLRERPALAQHIYFKFPKLP
jgi:hypothetical protein